jgi:tetratricopeptide (TPR) repeat protein
MKKITFLVVLLISTGILATAQNNIRLTAYNYLRKGKLDLAKENIDKAVLHEKTMNDPKTWFYYGNTYLNIATTAEEAYKNLDPDALQKSYEAYKKCMELDTENEYKIQILQDMVVISNNFYSKGLKFYNSDDFVNSYKEFNNAVGVNSSINQMDTLAVYAVAMSANSAKMYPEAIKGYTELIEMNYKNSTIYSDLAGIYRAQENLEKAKEVLQMGFVKFPSDVNILFAKINILLSENKYDEVINALSKAIELDPDNYTLYFVLGQSYENMKDFDKAVQGYSKAIELNPEYSDAIYNLGALYFNKGVEAAMKANDLPLEAEKEFAELQETAQKEYLKAEPFFEKALTMLPDDQALIRSLEQIYKSTKQMDKLNALKNR